MRTDQRVGELQQACHSTQKLSNPAIRIERTGCARIKAHWVVRTMPVGNHTRPMCSVYRSGIYMKGQPMNQPKPMKFSDSDLRERLTPAQYQVTQNAGTERAFTGEYWNCHDDGTYHCIVCDTPLFSSDTKFDSGTGWPSFWEAIDPKLVAIHSDRSFGMVREEAVCANCGAHLGHRFPDGPKPTGERYCMNSASLRLNRS